MLRFRRTKLHWIKNYYLRMRYGAGCCDTYTLYGYLASVIAVSLKLFDERTHSYPMGMTEKEWSDILKEMREGFEIIARWEDDESVENRKKAERALDLFREHFFGLWI